MGYGFFISILQCWTVGRSSTAVDEDFRPTAKWPKFKDIPTAEENNYVFCGFLANFQGGLPMQIRFV